MLLPFELTLSNLKPYPKSGHSYALGAAVALELFQRRPEAALGLIVSPDAGDNAGVSRLIGIANASGLPMLTSARAIERLSPKGNCYAIGVFAPCPDALDAEANHVVLVSPGDAGNLGTILRSALAFGVRDVALIGGADPFDPRVVRASMGALFSMRIARYDDFNAYTADISSRPRSLYPFMLDAQTLLHDAVPQAPFSLILGNEADGLPEAFLRIGTPVRIAHSDAVDSLNLAVATAIGLWHFTKPGG